MNDEKMIYYGQTDMGRQRTNNEDAYVVQKLDAHTILAVAIDGVGGYEGGEVAAEIAQREIPLYLKEFNRGERLELLKQAVVCANNKIQERRKSDSARSNMSCVLTAALIDSERKVVDMVHVGDTRMYQFHHGELRKLSHDHSLIGYREEIGDLEEEEAMHHPQRNVISRDVGSARHEVGDPDFLEAETFPLLPNSTFLFCSDGLTDMITSKQIIAILTQPISLIEKTQALIDAANEAGGKDNVTVVLVEYQAEEVQPPVAKDVVSPVENDIEESNSNVTVENASEKINEDKKVRGKMLWVLFAVIALLLGTCVALFLWVRAEQKQVKDLQARIEQVEPSSAISDTDNLTGNQTCFDTADVENFVKRYSKAYIENDFETISQLYAPQVRKYCDSCNLSNNQVIEKYKNYDRKFGVNSKHSDIRWETLKLIQLPDYEIFVEYIEDYKIDRKDTTKPSNFVLLKHIVLDTNAKIVSFDDVTISSGR